MSMISEFKAFVLRGNVLDLAIAVVIGAAFGTVVKSFTDDVLMPPIGLLLGHTDFSSLYINLSSRTFASYVQAKAAGAPVIGIGAFINNVISFLIIAFAVFLLIHATKRFKKPVGLTMKTCPYCASAIPLEAIRCPLCTSDLQTDIVLSEKPA
jgi:large conductance mechanosensitive channel